nr:DUF368 domain-containing protein [Clostridia bacterium]
MKLKNFFIDAAKGAAIGAAMIIPGVSGGTLAVLLNVYDKLISAISNILKDFKRSVITLFPILLGAVLAIAAAYFPLKYALKYAPFPTVMLFGGLMLGSCPKIVKDGMKNGFKKLDILSVALPLLLVIGICFIPNLGSADLSTSMPVWGYFVLLLVGAVASCALVVPGVSGSMLLLIFGYYNEILDTVSLLKTDFGHAILVLLTFAVGIIVGFFSIAKLMKYLLGKFPRVTNWAIIGFVVGSIPAIFITYNNNFPDFVYSSLSVAHIVVGCVLCVLGIIGAYALTAYVEHKNKQTAEQPIED